MAWTPHSWGLRRLLTLLLLLVPASGAHAIALDEEGTINFGVRAYANIRVGTTAKQSTRPDHPNSFGGTFPYSGAGNLIQNRYFLEAQWEHDILGKVSDILPKSVSELSYTLTYRGEYEGLYDFGPKEYSHSGESEQELIARLHQLPTFDPSQLQAIPSILYAVRHRLRQVASYRNRLFEAFADYEQGPVFVRFGRQNLVWGETDVFRLLDNINPVDNSFGGFFIDLDERRLPLDMLRASYSIGDLGPVEQSFLEGYVAYDSTVAYVPGSAEGSPWAIPLGPPVVDGKLIVLKANPRSPSNLRGGGRLVFNVGDFTFSGASYLTILDIPAVRMRAAVPTDPFYQPGISQATFKQYGPRVWINGASMTTALPDLQGVLRAEFAWIQDEALFRGATPATFPGTGLTPQYFNDFLNPVLQGDFDTVTPKDTVNFSLGWDMNQFIRFLNSHQSFFFTTQVFVRQILDRDELQAYPIPQPNNSLRFIPQPGTQILQTLLINTTYKARVPFTENLLQVTPSFTTFYDWQGTLLFQPGIRFVRDPWRLIVDYVAINSGVYRVPLGIFRDKGNVRIQIEYVL